jgi:hypothetical protein
MQEQPVKPEGTKMNKNKKIYQFGDFLVEERPSSSNAIDSILAIKDSSGKIKFEIDARIITLYKSKLEEFSKKHDP